MRAVLILILACGVAAPPRAQDGSELFDPAKTSLEPGAAAAVAADLVRFAQDQARVIPEYPITGGYRKLVRVAYQLASGEPAVAAAHARIKNGLPPEAPDRAVSRDTLMKVVLELLAKVKGGERKDDPAVARYLCATGLVIDPQHEDCLAESEKLFARGKELSWTRALAAYRPVIAGGTTSSIQGLVVLSAGTAEVGALSRIVLTYRAMGGASLDVELLREGSDQTQVSAEEAIRYWDRLRKHVPLPGGVLEISFEDKFNKKDGPSAGAAFAVLLRSFSDPFPIDPAFAMTGDVSVDGRILQVGGVYAKIRGAVMGGTVRVGVPLANELDLTDAVVLNGPSTLAEIEIYGLETVEDAIAVGRANGDPRTKRVTTEFAGLKALVEKKLKANDAATTAAIGKITGSILAAAPKHLSARLLEAWNAGKLPARLSLAASLEQSSDLLHGYFHTIRTGEDLTFDDLQGESKPAGINEVLRRMRELSPKIHADATKPATKLESVCVAIKKFIDARGPLDAKEKKVNDHDRTIQELKQKIEKAKAENRPPEHINGLVRRHNQEIASYNSAVDSYNKAAEDRAKTFRQVIDLHNEYITILRTLTQDPKLLEKLTHGK